MDNLKNDSTPLNELTFTLEDLDNGLCFKEHYIPEELVVHILSFINPEELLALGLVCRKWYNITRSYQLWSMIYENKYKKKPKKLPWYVFYSQFATNYFDTNFIKNGNGEKGFEQWAITRNGGDGFNIESHPVGASPLPLDVPEFNEQTSCFVTSYSICRKHQTIRLKNRLFLYILDKYKPHLYASEWVSGRFDCGSRYLMAVKLLSEKDEILIKKLGRYQIDQWGEPRWTKVEVVLTEYYDGARGIVFEHEGKDSQFWKGHYGTKMAGAVVKFIFDSIQEKGEDKGKTTKVNT